MYMWFVWEVQLLCVCHYQKMLGDWGARVEHWLRELLVLVLHLVLGVGESLNLHFLRKWWYLSVILLDPLTLIRYWWSGRAVRIFPVMFHQWLNGLWIATVSPACKREGCGYICYTFLLLLHCGGREFLHGVALPLPIQGMVCRGLTVKEWNHGVGGGVGVAPVICQYFGLGCFSTARCPRQYGHCPRKPGGLCFHSLSSLRFSPQALPDHWVGDMRWRIVSA